MVSASICGMKRLCRRHFVDWRFSLCFCRQYTAHVRLHFVTNLGVAGGLILLQNFGAGRSVQVLSSILQRLNRMLPEGGYPFNT
jgi:hypothetical protein